jgi:hypothetical protein
MDDADRILLGRRRAIGRGERKAAQSDCGNLKLAEIAMHGGCQLSIVRGQGSEVGWAALRSQRRLLTTAG